MSRETPQAREKRLANDRKHKNAKLACDTPKAKAALLAKRREKYHAKKLQRQNSVQNRKETDQLSQSKLPPETNSHSSNSVASLNKSSGTGIQSKISRNVARKHLLLDTQQNYLQNFNSTLHGPLHDQPWAKSNMQKFHTSTQYFINQCIICRGMANKTAGEPFQLVYLC